MRYNRIDATKINGTCPCTEGFFNTNFDIICAPCHNTCRTCVGEKNDDCMACHSESTLSYL